MSEHAPELSTIVYRLERVEKENRMLKRVGLGALVLAGAMLLVKLVLAGRWKPRASF